MRRGATIRKFNSKEVQAGRGLGAEFRIANNDEVFVDLAPFYYLYGYVNKAGEYPLLRPLTVQQAISVGGGVAVLGSEWRIRIKRKSGNGQTYEVPLRLTTRSRQAIRLSSASASSSHQTLLCVVLDWLERRRRVLSVSQILAILLRRAWIVVLSLLTTTIVAGAVLLFVPGRYDAVATASIDPGNVDPITDMTNGAGMIGLMQGNILALVASQRVATDVVRRLNLTENPRFSKISESRARLAARASMNGWPPV